MELTWLGHATALIDVGDYRIITDPLLTKRVAHLRRRRSVPTSLGADVADVDLVLLSHLHLDHFHLPSLRLLRPNARILAPRGSLALLRKAGLHNVTELEVGDRVGCGPVTIEVVPAAHKHGRGPHTRVAARPVGYVVDSDDQRCYFAGDTDLFDGMADLREIDIAMLPIWGWGPTIGEGHLDPLRAVAAAELIRPKLVVPIHWGTYAPEDGRRRLPTWFEDPALQFASAMVQADDHQRLRLLEPGEQITC
ncbi:MAG: MBL fold metallo-hydrolase [Ilumatobacteraceae bacterium]|nr:MBL fold metallo-hydrolase [Ilumatobacteraceae bacterium]